MSAETNACGGVVRTLTQTYALPRSAFHVQVSSSVMLTVGGESDGGPVSVAFTNQVLPLSAENATCTQPQLAVIVALWTKLPVTGEFAPTLPLLHSSTLPVSVQLNPDGVDVPVTELPCG